jgi:hypothetical protein
MTTMTTAALHAADKINGMKASGMTAGKFGHVLDADGYVIPEKFDATFANGKWVMDEKFDGHRDQIVKLGDDVRHTLKSVALPEHLRAAVAQVPFDVVLDGELRIPGGISTDVPNGKLRAQLEFVAFDVISLMGDDVTHLTYTERRELLEAVAVHFAGTQVVLATQYPVTFANVRAIWARNGEGVILKLKTSTYRQGYRSGDWLKVKRLEHHTVTVTGFEAGSLGPTAVVNFRFDDGATGQCKNLNNEELARTAAAPESFIGAKLVVQCQQRTRGGAARHPMFDHWAGEAE